MSRVLVVDDDPAVRTMIHRYLSSGLADCDKADNGQEAWEMIAESDYDVVITDLHMPQMGGMELLTQLRIHRPEIAVIVITGESEIETGRKAMEIGVSNYLIKPFKLEEIAINMDIALRRKKLELETSGYQQCLEEKIKVKEKALCSAEEHIRRSYRETIFRLTLAAEYRDNETSAHLQRISIYTQMLSTSLGLDDESVEMLALTSQMHDIGKIGIPDNILMKAGKLTREEFEIIKTHAQIGANILSGSSFPFLEMACEIAQNHHESYDGNGYPVGLAGDDIPLSGRIVSVCDVFDALTSNRPYRVALSLEEAKRIMTEDMKSQFDPEILSIFISKEKDLTEVVNAYTEDADSFGRYNHQAG